MILVITGQKLGLAKQAGFSVFTHPERKVRQ